MGNHVRIIAGLWRGKHIPVSDNAAVRPTGDRIRETLFNWLGNTLHEARCLDLFCGSGILGLEALSRGAAAITFVDNNSEVITQLKKTVESLPLAQKSRVSILQQDALSPRKSSAYDIIFLDPPFKSDLLTRCMPLLKQYGYEKPGTLVYIEIAATELLTLPQHWQMIKEGKAGNVRYYLIEVMEEIV